MTSDPTRDDGQSTTLPWTPQFLCASLKSPIVLSDGRVTTCTLDHGGQNELANIHQHSFDETVERYQRTRYSAMANPMEKPMCQGCYTKLPRWQSQAVPRAGWMKQRYSEAEIQNFKSAFDPQKLSLNLELSSEMQSALHRLRRQ